MPSPVGHTLAGLCGFILVSQYVAPRQRLQLLLGSVFIANMPDLDILPGLLLGNPSSFHRQGTHSLTAAAVTEVIVALLAKRWKLRRIQWGIWAAGVYTSHIFLDMLLDDPSPPFGVQALWPFLKTYFISPITVFASFDYFDPAQGMVRTMLSAHNFLTVLQEIVLLLPFVWLAWYFFGKSYSRKHFKR